MAVSRFQIASNKKSAILKQNMRATAVLLAEDPPKEEKARIKAESLLRDDNLIEAFDILSLECELLSERIKLLEFSKECPPDLVSCVSTLIYAAPRVDIPELAIIRKQFRAKYGKKFEEAALSNSGGVLNERVVTKLSVHPPAAYLVQTYLERIAEKHDVNWTPTIKLNADQMCEPMAPPVGYSVHVAQGTGLGPVAVSTGQLSTDQEINYTKPDNRDSWVDPPRAPTATVYLPASTIEESKDDFEEPDIFIPAAPGQPAKPPPVPSQPLAPPSAPNASKDGDDDDDDDDDEDNTPSGPPAQINSSYRDLAARFDALKKL
jgi:hypothetical protein